jgi:hypothetical protein
MRVRVAVSDDISSRTFSSSVKGLGSVWTGVTAEAKELLDFFKADFSGAGRDTAVEVTGTECSEVEWETGGGIFIGKRG